MSSTDSETQRLEDHTVYVTLEVRGIPGTFHWGVFVTSSVPQGVYYHATNKFGGWQLEVKETINILDSLSLAVIYKIAPASSQSRIDQVLRTIPADGAPSLRNEERFTCRTWAKDAIMGLQQQGLIGLLEDIDTLETSASGIAKRVEPRIEKGGKPHIVSSSS